MESGSNRLHPIQKVPSPLLPQDYRPISITSVLCRQLERFVVKYCIYPTLNNPPPTLNFIDQFAFRPTGSTTAALISILNTLTTSLQTNSYVMLFALDFSKAFDTVRHSTLLSKAATMPLPDNIYNWLVSFLANHSHYTASGDETSPTEYTTASVIQGSAIGPAAFIINAADLAPIDARNSICRGHLSDCDCG